MPSHLKEPQTTPGVPVPASDVPGLSHSHEWLIAKFPTIDAMKNNLVIRYLYFASMSCVVTEVCLSKEALNIRSVCLKGYNCDDLAGPFHSSFDATMQNAGLIRETCLSSWTDDVVVCV